MDNKPLLGITMGDPAGIGPEIIVKALADPEVYGWCRPLVIGDIQAFKRALEYTGLTRMIVRTVEMPDEGSYTPGVVDLLPASSGSIPPVPLGTVTAAAGAAAYAAIIRSIDLGMDKLIDGVVTAPINKTSLHEAGVKHAGHTEIFSSATGAG
ncbi:MAG: 4-hydroxythreonine-4-phosphate dehydrogenase PdxA, partial [Spirochaetia bacterium]|nr:4-hydroxythreonine-4-phosphate dehydrogenase PdxA [Spirochaetia bacterium]